MQAVLCGLAAFVLATALARYKTGEIRDPKKVAIESFKKATNEFPTPLSARFAFLVTEIAAQRKECELYKHSLNEYEKLTRNTRLFNAQYFQRASKRGKAMCEQVSANLKKEK